MNKEKWERLIERLKHPGAERLKALTKIKQFAQSDVPLIFDLNIDELLVAILNDKLTSVNELQFCLGALLSLMLTHEQKKTLVQKGILPALVMRTQMSSEQPNTVALASGVFYELESCAQATAPQWIAAQVPKRLCELLAVGGQVAEIAGTTLWSLSNLEVFAPSLCDHSFLAYLISVLNFATLTPQQFVSTTKQKKALSMLCNLAMWEYARPILISTGAIDVLSPLVKWEGYAGLRSTMGLAYLVGSKEDKASKLLIAQPHVTERLIHLLASTLHDEDSGYNTTWEDEEVLLAIQLLSVSDHNKTLLGTDTTIALLLEVLTTPTRSEQSQQLASSALLELSFNSEVMTRLKDPKHDIASVLDKCTTTLKGKPLHNINQLQWALNDKAHSSIDKLAVNESEAPKKGHIMMSYCWAHQPMVLKLARALQKSGHRVWLDLDAMRGSTADAMAQAVEDAAVLIVTVSEKYKVSPNCRLEAQYALQLKKPIIFLMMQKDYQPTGWLGLMLGAKMWYDLTEDAFFNERLEAIHRELALVLDHTHARDHAHHSNPPQPAAAAAMTKVDSSVSVTSRGFDLSEAKTGAAQSSRASIMARAVNLATDASQTHSTTLGHMSEADVSVWLEQHSLTLLVETFRTHNINGIALAVLWDIYSREGPSACVTMLRKDFGVTQMGAALCFVHHLASLCEGHSA
eukprot:m.233989 g.233989  ORF g.233989 m.233989 type:complete len:689 (+) comp19376_c0_seq1:75-2141(+)